MKGNVIKKSNNEIVELSKGIIEGEILKTANTENGEFRVMFQSKKGRWDFNDFNIDDYKFAKKKKK